VIVIELSLAYTVVRYSSRGCRMCVLSYPVSTPVCQSVSTTSARCLDHRCV